MIEKPIENHHILNLDSKPSACTKCHGELQYIGHGQYKCMWEHRV